MAPEPRPKIVRRWLATLVTPVAVGSLVVEPSGRGHPVAGPEDDALTAGHELRDANASKLAVVIAVMFGGVAFAVALMVALVGVFQRPTPSRAPLTAQQSATINPPGPHLEADPAADLATLRARQAAQLDSYAWIDAAHTHARIPITRAMALTVGHSLDGAP